MILTCDHLKEALTGFAFVKDCVTLPNGTLRIATPFRYPDGSLIDVFLKDDAKAPDIKDTFINGCVLSDYGQTMGYLMDLHIRPHGNPHKRAILQDVCAALRVEYRAGELQKWIDPRDMEAVADGIIELAQACVRVADLSFLSRFGIRPEFNEDVGQFLRTVQQVRIEGPGVGLPGRWGRDVLVDFIVRSDGNQSLLKTVSTGGASANIHPQLAEAFCRWTDLKESRPQDRLITVIDDKEQIKRHDDVDRLKTISQVVHFPREQKKLAKLVSAA
jgi:hypothetical protein